MRLSFALLLVSAVEPIYGSTGASSTIWFGQPANSWTDALPVGNGRLGAMVHGGYAVDRIGLNEDSIWSGGLQKRVNAKAAKALPSLLDAFDDGNLTGADQIWTQNLVGTPTAVRQYQPAGNMMIEFGQNVSALTGYNRSLDLSTGHNQVVYTRQDNKIIYYRHAIASYPLDVIGFRYSSNHSGALDMKIALTRNEGVSSLSVDLAKKTITMVGQGTNDTSLKFVQQLRIVSASGNFTANSTAITIQGGWDVKIYYTAETTFRHASIDAATTAMNTKLDTAAALNWNDFMAGAISDYSNLAGRVSLDVGNSGAIGSQDTGKRLRNWKSNGNVTSDPEFLALTYNYGRFLLISSSRVGSLPSNLQGVWNDKFVPPWGSRYTININTEMNYFPAETTNLAETHFPLFDHLKRMQDQGHYVARQMYNMSGWVCHHNTDLWGDCVPVDARTHWSANPFGGAWLAYHLVEHYYFSGNNTWATSTALPILSDALTFYYDFLIPKDGWYVPTYDSSPENSYVIPDDKIKPNSTTGIDQGTAHARQLLYGLFKGFIDLSNGVGSTTGVNKAKQYLARIEPPEIGQYGQIMEWSEDYEEPEPGHRHLSNLVGVYPEGQISPLINKTASDAALVSIDRRIAAGSGNMGWSKAWAAGIYARLLQGDKATYHLCDLINKYLAGNLFDLNGNVFQIDGNLGFTGALTEIFLQSHAGVVHLAPALPTNLLASGSVSGLMARGGFLVSIEWADHKLVSATVKSQRGGTLALRVEAGRAFKVNGATYSSSISTTAGTTYTITV